MQWRSLEPYKASGLICGEQDSSSVPERLRSLVAALPSEKILTRESFGGFLMPLNTDCVMLSMVNFRLCCENMYEDERAGRCM